MEKRKTRDRIFNPVHRENYKRKPKKYTIHLSENEAETLLVKAAQIYGAEFRKLEAFRNEQLCLEWYFILEGLKKAFDNPK